VKTARWTASLVALAFVGALPAASTAARHVAPAACNVAVETYQFDLPQCLKRAQKGKVSSIVLADGVYTSTLDASGRRFAADVTISGSRGVDLAAGIDMSGSSHLVLQGLTVAPQAGGAAVVDWTGAADHLTLDHVLLDGSNNLDGGARLVTNRSGTDLLIHDSEFRQCGHGFMCIDLGAANLQVVHNVFASCEQCNFLKGGASGPNGLIVRGNTFGSIYKSSNCSSASCIHLDAIHMEGGGPWNITRNSFADCGHNPTGATPDGDCTADVFIGDLGGTMHDVYIANNVFQGKTNRAVLIGNYKPQLGRITIVNNTFANTGGSPSILLMKQWEGPGGAPQPNAPLIANNIESLGSGTVCTRARHYTNLVIAGKACKADDHGTADFHGQPLLDPRLAPTAKSKAVLGRATPAYAPKYDLLGRARGARPDIGAVQSTPHK
jgi:hypothetical protein